jgi:hypothetical protein
LVIQARSKSNKLLGSIFMKPTLIAVLLAFTLNNAFAAEITSATDKAKPRGDVRELPAGVADFCFFTGKPPADAKYKVVRQLKLGKGTYGGVKDILPKFVQRAQKLGADAIINYTGSQRFGFWPWRMVRPVVRGVAVKWDEPKNHNCAAIGGTTLQTMLAKDKAPPQ